MNRIVFSLALQCLLPALLLAACASLAPQKDFGPLPAACQEKCISPFGMELGRTSEGQVAHSNCRPDCVYEKPSFEQGTYAGIEWQCVEFARRWLIRNRHATFPSIDIAADLWDKVDALERLGDHEKLPLRKLANGSRELPAPGDLLIWQKEYLGTGHVAIVLEVDTAKSVVRVGEENFTNEKWPASYAREIHFGRSRGRYWLVAPYLLGWATTRP
jgi:CHAP domain